jgi:hypothetical protein
MITRTPGMRAARAEQRRKEWTRKHAGLFHDETAEQLKQSLLLLAHQEDGAPLMYISPADLIAMDPLKIWRENRAADLAKVPLDFTDDETH